MSALTFTKSWVNTSNWLLILQKNWERKEGREGGRKEGRQEGRKERRKEGGKEGKKEGGKEGTGWGKNSSPRSWNPSRLKDMIITKTSAHCLFLYIRFSWDTVMPICFHFALGCFGATMAELSCCDRDHSHLPANASTFTV